MFKKESRLQKEKDIEAVFKKGKGFKAGSLSLKMLKNDSPETRFAVVVSQKVAKRASLRNRVKRRLREIIKEKEKETRRGVDVIVIALPGLERKNFGETREGLLEIFSKAKLLERK